VVLRPLVQANKEALPEAPVVEKKSGDELTSRLAALRTRG